MDRRTPPYEYSLIGRTLAMHLEEHPFHILGITSRSSKKEIFERADALSLHLDFEKINAYRFQVTHPAKRIDAEVSWFPGVSPSKLCQLIGAIEQDSKPIEGFEEQLSGVECLGKFNAFGYWLAAQKKVSRAAFRLALEHLAQNLQRVDIAEVMTILNADRAAAGLPQITDVPAIKDAVKRRGENAASSLAEQFFKGSEILTSVLTPVVVRDTDNGNSDASEFVGQFVDRYQVQVQPVLHRYREQISAGCKRILSIAQQQSAPGARMNTAIEELEDKVSSWGEVAEPIQLVMKSRGLTDTPSIDVAMEIRGMSVTLANEFGLHEQAQQVTMSLAESFSAVPELVDLLQQDLSSLEAMVRAKVLDGGGENCPQCGRRLTSLGSVYSCTNPECGSNESISGGRASPDKSVGARASDGRANVDGFVQLCQSIRLKHWQRIQPSSTRFANLAIFITAYSEYCDQVSPWLKIICDTYRGDTLLTAKAQNAAAECLNSLAGGFLLVSDLDTAQTISLEALALVLSNDRLKAEIQEQLREIELERAKAMKSAEPSSADKPRPSSGLQDGTTGISGGKKGKPSLFDNWRSRTRLTWILPLGVCLLTAIPIVIHFVTVGQDTSPPVESPIAEKPVATTAELPALQHSSSPAEPDVSLPNGTNLIRPHNAKGLGKLKISNYTGSDAAVKLKTSLGRTTVRFIYVRAMSDVSVTRISVGEYILQYAMGRDWDTSNLVFRRDSTFATFDEVLSFSEERVGDRTIYSTYEITLHAVPNGNVEKKSLSATEFSEDIGAGGNTTLYGERNPK